MALAYRYVCRKCGVDFPPNALNVVECGLHLLLFGCVGVVKRCGEATDIGVAVIALEDLVCVSPCSFVEDGYLYFHGSKLRVFFFQKEKELEAFPTPFIMTHGIMLHSSD